MREINLTLDVQEAHLLLAAVGEARVTALIQSAGRGDAAEYADVRAKVLGRVATQIVDGMESEDPRLHILRQEAELGML